MLFRSAADLLAPGDLIVDGGNANYLDSQRRGAMLGERGIGFADALKQFWAPTLAGLVLTFVFASVSVSALIVAAPVLISLICVIPFAMLTAHPRFSAWLVAQRIGALPEELPPA